MAWLLAWNLNQSAREAKTTSHLERSLLPSEQVVPAAPASDSQPSSQHLRKWDIQQSNDPLISQALDMVADPASTPKHTLRNMNHKLLMTSSKQVMEEALEVKQPYNSDT